MPDLHDSIPAVFVFFVLVVAVQLTSRWSPFSSRGAKFERMTERRIAAIFDLDGTLVQTEALKAQSYARAAVELAPDTVREQDVIAAYDEMVGHSREDVAATLLARFGLEAQAGRRMARARCRDAARCVPGAAAPHLRGDDRRRAFDSRAGVSAGRRRCCARRVARVIPSALRQCRTASTRCSCSSGSGSRARWMCS